MKKSMKVLLATVLLATFSSCDERGSIGPDSQTSATNASYLAVLNVVSAVNYATANQALTQSQASAAIYPINSTQNCLSGGSTTITGTLSMTSSGNGLQHFSYNYLVTFNQCTYTGLDGSNYSVDGTNVAVVGTSDWTITGTGVSEIFNSSDNASVSGNIEISGGTSMSCNVALTESMAQNGSNNSTNESGSLTGTLCGQQINEPMTASVTVSS